MAGKCSRWWIVGAGLLALLAPTEAWAGPYFGDWGWCWHPAPDCVHGEYSHLHYWAPAIYYVRMYCRPSNLDQYPPGPTPPVPPSYIVDKHRCRTIPPAPSWPYADPTAYYGRPVAPE